MHRFYLPKIWFAFRGLLDSETDEAVGIGKARARVFAYSLAQIFDTDISKAFDENFADDALETVTFPLFRRFITEQLLAGLNNTDKDSPADRHEKFSSACWVVCKRKHVPAELATALPDPLIRDFWDWMITASVLDRSSGTVRLPVFLEREELQLILLELAKQLSQLTGCSQEINEKIQELVTRAAENSEHHLFDLYGSDSNAKRHSSESHNSDYNVEPTELIDFPQALAALKHFVEDQKLQVDCVGFALKELVYRIYTGCIERGSIFRLKDVAAKAASASGRDCHFEISPTRIELSGEDGKKEKPIKVNVSAAITVESALIKEPTRTVYRFKLLDNNMVIALLDCPNAEVFSRVFGAFRQATILREQGIEHPMLHEFSMRQEERRQHMAEQAALEAEQQKTHEENEKVYRCMQSEVEKAQRTILSWNEEREPTLKANKDLKHALERAQSNNDYLEKQLMQLREVRERLQAALSRVLLHKNELRMGGEEFVSSNAQSARLDEELHELERIERKFDKYKNASIRLHESYTKLRDQLKASGHADAALDAFESDPELERLFRVVVEEQIPDSDQEQTAGDSAMAQSETSEHEEECKLEQSVNQQ